MNGLAAGLDWRKIHTALLLLWRESNAWFLSRTRKGQQSEDRAGTAANTRRFRSGRCRGGPGRDSRTGMGQRSLRFVTEPLHGRSDCQRHPGSNRIVSVGGCERNLRPGKRMASGRYKDPDVDLCYGGRTDKPCRDLVDPPPAPSALGAMAPPRAQRQGEAFGPASGRTCDHHPDPGGTGNMDPHSGPPQRTTAAVQDCANLLTHFLSCSTPEPNGGVDATSRERQPIKDLKSAQ